MVWYCRLGCALPGQKTDHHRVLQFHSRPTTISQFHDSIKVLKMNSLYSGVLYIDLCMCNAGCCCNQRRLCLHETNARNSLGECVIAGCMVFAGSCWALVWTISWDGFPIPSIVWQVLHLAKGVAPNAYQIHWHLWYVCTYGWLGFDVVHQYIIRTTLTCNKFVNMFQFKVTPRRIKF